MMILTFIVLVILLYHCYKLIFNIILKMKCGIPGDVIHKEVVIIGNGPSGIALSYMLSGNLPFLKSDYHPDEMLSARLRRFVGECLVDLDLEELAVGLEGRSTNYISLLLDALLRPCADMGLEMEPLVEFRKAGNKIDHIVLGKGPPGGTWHKMDPYILTLSLGSWMALPGLPFHCNDSGEKRAYAYNVARYYEKYVKYHNLTKYFRNNVEVTNVTPMGSNTRIERCLSEKNVRNNKKDLERMDRLSVCLDADIPDEKSTCFISNAINCLLLKANRKKNRCCKRPHDLNREQSPSRKIREIESTETDPIISNSRDKSRSISLCCDSDNTCDIDCSKSFTDSYSFNHNTLRSSYSLDFCKPRVPFSFTSTYNVARSEDSWLVSTVEPETGHKVTYSCKYLVLANGSSDLPNKLEIEGDSDPSWLVHDLRTLENKLDREIKLKRQSEIRPVLIVGAGLSAADAVIATRGRNIPVAHVFRNKSSDLNKQLPENLYPEYHKVRQMMKDGGSTYTAYPEYTLTGLDENSRTVTLTSKTGEKQTLKVSFTAVLIGSRPDLSFLPEHKYVGVNKNMPVDCKTNTIDINKTSHKVNGYKNLFAIGPLAGDYFVRFIPGGALAVVSELYKQNKYLT